MRSLAGGGRVGRRPPCGTGRAVVGRARAAPGQTPPESAAYPRPSQSRTARRPTHAHLGPDPRRRPAPRGGQRRRNRSFRCMERRRPVLTRHTPGVTPRAPLRVTICDTRRQSQEIEAILHAMVCRSKNASFLHVARSCALPPWTTCLNAGMGAYRVVDWSPATSWYEAAGPVCAWSPNSGMPWTKYAGARG